MAWRRGARPSGTSSSSRPPAMGGRRRGPAMGDLTLVFRQTYYGLKSTSRNPRAVVFALLFPIVFLLLFNSIFAKQGDTVGVDGTSVPIESYFTGGLMAYAIMLNCFSTLVIS